MSKPIKKNAPVDDRCQRTFRHCAGIKEGGVFRCKRAAIMDIFWKGENHRLCGFCYDWVQKYPDEALTRLNFY